MTPTRSVRCDHPLDEWCDRCYMPVWDRQMVALLDRPDPSDLTTSPAFERLVADVARAYGVDPSDVRVEFVDTLARATRAYTPPPAPCINGRHRDHVDRRSTACDNPLPPPHALHRAVGTAAVGTVTGAVIAVAGVMAAAEWLAGPGRLYATLAGRFAVEHLEQFNRRRRTDR